MKTNQINLFIQKGKGDEIIKVDYNYTCLEKEIKQKRRKVKVIISKVYREPEEDKDTIDFDPFSRCVRHTGKKFDKIFRERKNASARIKNKGSIKSRSVFIRDDNINKKFVKFKGKISKEERFMIKNKSEKKTGNVIFKNLKDKKKYFDINTYKNIGKSRSVGMFKIKEKKAEYLKDYDNNPNYFN